MLNSSCFLFLRSLFWLPIITQQTSYAHIVRKTPVSVVKASIVRITPTLVADITKGTAT